MSASLKTMNRFVRVMMRYRWAGISFALRFFDYLPGFSRSVNYLENRYQAKMKLKEHKKSIGHALGDRTIVCSFLGRPFLKVRIEEGEQATADQFFLNRPVNDAKRVIALAGRFADIRPGDLVFDPGCGAGRHLFHFVDHYGCRAVGVDIYPPAIAVAETANWDRKISFYAQSSLEPGLLDKLMPEGCDFAFINSWLNHVKDYPGFADFSRQIVEKSRFLLVITSTKNSLEEFFENPEILIHEVQDKTRFALLRGSRE